MSFSIAPKDGASAPSSATSPAQPQSARDRVVAKIAAMRGLTSPAQAQATPVSNPSQVSAEEMTAISPTKADTLDQTHKVEGTAEASSPAETTEAPAEVTKPKEEPLSSQYAQLARKEKALRAEALKLKAERDSFKAEREAAKAPAAPSVDPSQYIPKERLTKDTLAVLSEMGIGYDQLTQMALNGPSPEQLQLQQTISELRNEIKSLKDEHTSTKTSIEESQRQGYQQALKQIKTDASRLVASDPDAYEAIQTAGAVDDVVDLIERTFKEDGTLMTVEEAAQAVEEHLAEEALKYARLKKIQARLKPATPPASTAQPGATTPKQPQAAPPKTLTNAVSVPKPMSSKERAIMAAKFGPGWREKV